VTSLTFCFCIFTLLSQASGQGTQSSNLVLHVLHWLIIHTKAVWWDAKKERMTVHALIWSYTLYLGDETV
jgi:hypothetical protein